MNEDEYRSIIEYYKYSCWTPIICNVFSIDTCLLYRDPCTPLICDVRKCWPSTYILCYKLTKTFTEGQLSIIASNRLLKFVFDECNCDDDSWTRIISDCIWRKENKAIRQYIYIRCKNMFINNEYNRKLIRVAGNFEKLRNFELYKKYSAAISRRNKVRLFHNQHELEIPGGYDWDCRNWKIKFHYSGVMSESRNILCKWINGRLKIVKYTRSERNHTDSIKAAMLMREEKKVVFTIPCFIACELIKICKENRYMIWQK